MGHPVRVGWADAELRGYRAEAADHGGEDLLRRDVVGEAVGVREEVAFERGGVGREVVDEGGVVALGGEKFIARGETGLVDGIGDVKDVDALGDGDGDGVDIASHDAGVDLGGGSGMVKAGEYRFDHPAPATEV